jgi:hypothetical protein
MTLSDRLLGRQLTDVAYGGCCQKQQENMPGSVKTKYFQELLFHMRRKKPKTGNAST